MSHQAFWRRCRGFENFSKGSLTLPTSPLCFQSCLVYFSSLICLLVLSKKQKTQKKQNFSFYLFPVFTCFAQLLCLVLCLLSMVTFFETRSYWQGGFTESQQKYYKEYRLSQKGIDLWKKINQLNVYARNLCSIYDKSYCCDESCCFMMFQHLHFQC